MRLIRNLKDGQLTEESVVTIGSFDGLHRGHQKLIAAVRASALDSGRTSVVITFFPHPSVVLGRAQPFYLTSPEEKIAQLNKTGVDLVVELAFTPETAQTRAAVFVDELIQHLRMRDLWIGRDFALGHNREGNAEFLTRLGQERGFAVHLIDPVTNGNEVISSSSIRAALREGDIVRAADWLGRPFRLSGRVVPGDGRGRTIGVPTANLDIWAEHAVPADGVYACWAWVGNLRHKAAVNIGTRPTVTQATHRTVEAHLIDFDKNIYGLSIALDFVFRLRSEYKFPSVEALVKQIKADVANSRDVLIGE